MLPETLLKRVRELYNGPERGYHAWSHPEALLKLLSKVEGGLNDPLAVRCAILFHDAIYEPRASDNEQRSAVLADEMLRGIVPDECVERAVRLIQSTAKHAIPTGLAAGEASDMAIFLDMDLSILGASAEVFDAYEAGVGHEYREVPTAAFRAGRAAILEGFLARDFLYFSDWGRAQFERRARKNLARSVKQLQQD